MQTQPEPGRGEGESWHAGVGGNLRTEAEGEDGMIQDGTGGGRGRVPQDPPREGEGGGQCDSLDCTFRKRETACWGAGWMVVTNRRGLSVCLEAYATNPILRV